MEGINGEIVDSINPGGGVSSKRGNSIKKLFDLASPSF